MASHLAVICRLINFKAINMSFEQRQLMYGSRHYSEDQLFISPQTNIAGQLSPRYFFSLDSNDLYTLMVASQL